MATTLADLRLAAQQRCDRVNGPMTTQEWNSYVNGSLGALYRLLTSTYDDYNVQAYSFTLAGGDGGNTLAVGFGSTVPLFDKIRSLSRVVSSTAGTMSAQYVPVIRADSFLDFDALSAPTMSSYYGTAIGVKYMLYGTMLEIRPAASSAASYLMRYVPVFVKLVEDADTIDGTWMATSGIEEFVVLDSAAKALIKEESLDSANLILQQCAILKTEILGQFAQRDDNQPGRIQDTKSARRGGYGGRWL